MSKDIVVHNIPPSPCQDIQPTDTLKPYAREKLYCESEHKNKSLQLTRCKIHLALQENLIL